MGDIEKLGLKLGRQTTESDLDPIPRELGRKQLPRGVQFFGYDLWNAWEISFLLPSGKPAVYHGQISYPADSPFMVESKSFKLYLNSFNNRVFESVEAFAGLVSRELAECVKRPVSLRMHAPEQSPARRALPGICVDELEFRPVDAPDRSHKLQTSGQTGDYCFHSHLLRSNCPVTNQPDWGSVLIQGCGEAPSPESLLDYIVSYRNHQGFHESCCEMIFADLQQKLTPQHLTVSCFYTRRGGLDINPVRATFRDYRESFDVFWRQ